MVASPHALASAAGADALRAGGSAVDAAIATAAALGVLYPHMCGIGGDAFWLLYDAKEKRVAYLDGGGRAAASATLERFRGQAEIPFRGINCVGTLSYTFAWREGQPWKRIWRYASPGPTASVPPGGR